MTEAKESKNANIPDLAKHRAFYRAVSKQRWALFQKRELFFWQAEGALPMRQAMLNKFYLPLLRPFYGEHDPNQSWLEIGSGPICATQYLGNAQTTYVDPLLDDFRRLFPGVLPEKASYIASMLEDADLPASSFDRVLCLNSLSDVHNPELVMNKVGQVLKPSGYFIISMDLWPALLARCHCFLSRFVPGLPKMNRLYSYTRKGFVNTLSRHFNIVSVRRIHPRLHWLSFRQEWVFVCQLPEKRKV